ncbi:MAG: imidazole glycerol phosphate synthase subunit HisH [Gammaproteobacteria bacterium]|nr:imidazole glycerol phosphate synthase subunit HisH [Gammaproteobacteria bacterium]
MQLVAVVDYGGSNLRSVAKAVEFVADDRHEVRITDNPTDILNADRVVFPGQGAIGDCMGRLVERGLITTLQECLRTRPFFGICLGLQSLMQTSDEDGGVACLAAYPGFVRRFRADAGPNPDGTPRKIPHMGWNQVKWSKPHPLVAGIASGSRFYFVHSYFVVPDDDAVVMGRTEYIDSFVSALATGFVFATQFHPEKSATAGLQLLRNFLQWDGTV